MTQAKEQPRFTLEYADGFYIEDNGEGVIDFANPQDREFAEFVVDALNAAQNKKKDLVADEQA